MDIISREKLFFELFNAQVEGSVDQIITQTDYLLNFRSLKKHGSKI